MVRLAQLIPVAPLVAVSLASPAWAADPVQQAGSVFGSIEYEDLQATASYNDKVVSVVFDNFQMESHVGHGDLVVREVLGLSIPVKTDSPAVTALKADVRGQFLGSEGAGATLFILIGNEAKPVQFPTEPRQSQDRGDEPFIVSVSSAQRFAAGDLIPVTIVAVAHKPSSEATLLLAVDSLDMAVETE